MVYVTFVINEELMSLYQDLINLESENKPIKVGVIGAGQMGIGLIAQIATLKGMIVSGICNRTLSKAESAKAIYNKHTNRYHNCFITSDYKELIHSKEVDIVVECNGASTLYREEKEMRRVSNIISNMTGYPVSNIEVREIREV